jgi:hypothetical protein
VELAALDDRVVEHLGDGAAQRLGAVEHHQDRPGDLQATLAQPNQQLGDHGGVLGGALGQASGTLAVDGDPQRHQAGVLSRPGDEPTRDRRLGGPRTGPLDTAADRFQPGRVAARRQLGQHPLQRQLAQQLGRGEGLVGRHRHLTGAVG